MKCGIIGLPNVGKSTLFNRLTSLKAPAENYPFCTVDPNIGRVAVPDARLLFLSKIFQSEKTISASMEFVDIAGLIKGAHKGEGLGNQFLSHIRDVHALLHVVRMFKDEHISHTEQNIDPVRDIQLIDTELLLADVALLEKKKAKLLKLVKTGDKNLKAELSLVEKLLNFLLKTEKPARHYVPEVTEQVFFDSFRLLTAKPVLYVCNTDSDAKNRPEINLEKKYSAEKVLVLSARQEAGMDRKPSAREMPSSSAVHTDSASSQFGLKALIQKAYALLGLITFFTAGGKESRAWTIVKGTQARRAAGKIHSDFEKKFIKAEVYSVQDMEQFKSVEALRRAGRFRLEGQHYIVQDGDVILFKCNR